MQTPAFGLSPTPLFCCKTNLPNRFFRKTCYCCQETYLKERNLLIFGLGYLGKEIAVQLARQGWKVTGTKRKQLVDNELVERYHASCWFECERWLLFLCSGVEVIELDTESCTQLSETILQKLNLANYILVCIPANHRGDPLLSQLTDKVNLHHLSKERIRWIGYISSTVVYEPSETDSWIDESASLARHVKKASYYILAEKQWQRWTNDADIRLVIFRLSALYGPCRSALDTLIRIRLLHGSVEDFLQSSSFVGDVLVSRIHLIDACEKVIASMVDESMLPFNPCIVNLSDDLPSTRAECFYHALELLDESTVEAWSALHMIREDKQSFPIGVSSISPFQVVYGDKRIRTRISELKKGKRILNQRMKNLLGESLHFPTFCQGLLHVKNSILIRYRILEKSIVQYSGQAEDPKEDSVYICIHSSLRNHTSCQLGTKETFATPQSTRELFLECNPNFQNVLPLELLPCAAAVPSDGLDGANRGKRPSGSDTSGKISWEEIRARFLQAQSLIPGASTPVLLQSDNKISIKFSARTEADMFDVLLTALSGLYSSTANMSGLSGSLSKNENKPDIRIERGASSASIQIAFLGEFSVYTFVPRVGPFSPEFCFEKYSTTLSESELQALLSAYEAAQRPRNHYARRAKSPTRSYPLPPSFSDDWKDTDESSSYLYKGGGGGGGSSGIPTVPRENSFDELEEKLSRFGASVYHSEECLSWDTLAGYNELKQRVEETVTLALKYPEVYDMIAKNTRERFETNRPKAILFEGPPGTGKTSMARIIASRVGVPFVHVTMENVTSKYYGDSEKRLGKILKIANDYGPTVIFVDEIDAIALSRDKDLHEASRRVMSVLLRHLDGLEGQQQSILIAATNRKNDLDAALLSRFDMVFTFGLPDIKSREQILGLYAKHLSEKDRETLASLTAGFSGRTLLDACEEVERRWAGKIIRGEVKTNELPQVEEYVNVLKERKSKHFIEKPPFLRAPEGDEIF
ncbi:AAA-type ATPase isoform 1 [Galdieria sulphuraria]|uniref:AAA-type ATPase isoform 1 n=1 Tax=Galdieria sulphuraria TaxID=130081 RepID=M2W2T7_GALSU|nr:AAA-type ATPase isoform 1 [Galdieria sulphuraria]EME30011.1 AAA-type ATPase isoform 1 [Galdieria sulphuraria]|eukprot:XP_005706531.1 AAA-type ATPase isoform 1 [Galdieria sulphuraria]